jgi:hypothetical protein
METNESASSSAVPIPPLEQSAAFLREVIASQTALSPEQLQHLLSLVETGGAALTAQVGALQVAGDNLLAEQAARELQLAQHIHQAAQQATQQAMQQATQQAMQQAAQQASPPTGSKIRPSDCPTFDGNGRNVSQYATDIAVFQTIHGTYFSGNEVAMVAWLAKGLKGNAAVWFRNHCLSTGYGTLEDGALGDGPFPFPTLAIYLHRLREGHPGHAETELARQRLSDFVDSQAKVRPEHKGPQANLHYINGFRQLQLQLPGIGEEEQKHYFRKGLAYLDPTLAGAIIREGTLEASLASAMTKIEAGEIAIADHKVYSGTRLPSGPQRGYPPRHPRGEAMEVDSLELHEMQAQINALQQQLAGNGRGRGTDRGQGYNRGPLGRPRTSKHSAADQELIRTRRVADQCINCGSPDHYLRDCKVPGVIRKPVA